MDNDAFADRLASIIGRPAYDRPFVCDGSPLDCEVFIVGFNPATEMSDDFWTFWGPSGFNKAAWRRSYDRARKEAPLRPGKTRRVKESPTRRVIERIVVEATVPILETNLYTAASYDMKALEIRNRQAFEFLLSAISPRIVVAHGKQAQKAVASLVPARMVLSVPHFSRGWSNERATMLGKELAQLSTKRL